ncbi:MAG: GntP family permease [Limnochordia bacterium]|jgi:GntP family gluconate:H+ symporter|nr:GntP family permease [Bacillota bacterium]HOB08736.1 GntP family permease [Limnochordia bacterium]NLH31688.1 GntP family permease [Bacillota bacterium]HPZ30800.1 GntP family permease [Limnochordia bacterium]HQD71079.1 GntP family permease [Limnochordia bacterium]
MSGVPLIVTFVVAIGFMIYSISKLRIHPFLSIMGVSLLFAMVAGIPLAEIPGVIGTGFSNTFKSIGIVIIFGALIGTLLEKSGAALKMADTVVRWVGKRNPELAMLIMGWIVSIPVFCDSGFVILNPIRKALVKRTAKSSVACTVALSMGLYIAHCFIPPTPGPIAAANTLFQGLGQEANLLLVILMGVAASILPLIASYIFAVAIGKKVRANDEADLDGEITQTYEELVASYGKLPNALVSFAPIVVPILLMAFASALAMAGIQNAVIAFLGTPIIAIAVGAILALFPLASQNKLGEFHKLTNQTLEVSGPILFITAAGGVLGNVIASTSMVEFIKQNAQTISLLGLMFPFLLSAVLKTAQGSSTVALVTTAGIVAPMLPTLGLAAPVLTALTVIAIGAGAMTVSHANDSYFWVVTNFGAMKVEDGYKTQTLGTLVVGLASLINVYLIYFLIR